MAQSINPASFQFSLNGQPLQDKAMPTIINASYTDKGTEASDSLTISSATNQASSTTNWDVTIGLTRPPPKSQLAIWIGYSSSTNGLLPCTVIRPPSVLYSALSPVQPNVH